MAVSCTREEWEAGALAPAKLHDLTQQFLRDGFVVVCGVFPHEALDALVPRSDYQAARFVASGKGPHLDNGLPRMAPWVLPDIVANPIIEQLATAILGPGAFMRYWGGNCSLPVTDEQLQLHHEDESNSVGGLGGLQGLHMDSNFPWSWTSAEDAAAVGQPWPHKTQRIFLNFGTHTMNPHNGSTEIWPGTHAELAMAGKKGEKQLTEQVLTARRAIAAPLQVIVPKGGVLCRDVRCWHRGMPNLSNAPRHMLGLGFNAAHDPVGESATRASNNGRRDMVFSETAREAFAARRVEWGLERNIKFVDGEVDA